MLKYEVKENILSISFPSRPIKEDELETVYFEFADICDMASTHESVRVCALSGIGTQTFKCVTDSRSGLTRWTESIKIAPSLSRTARAIDVPLIIGMDGEIQGPGLELALFSDFRIATQTSSFRFPHVGMGWVPFEGATQMLPRIIGKSRALELLLTGNPVDAQDSRDMGLIHHLVPSGELDEKIQDQASKISRHSPTSLRYVKESVGKGLDLTLSQGLRLEADLYFLSHSTQDRIEGISAFKERRTPSFKGH